MKLIGVTNIIFFHATDWGPPWIQAVYDSQIEEIKKGQAPGFSTTGTSTAPPPAPVEPTRAVDPPTVQVNEL